MSLSYIVNKLSITNVVSQYLQLYRKRKIWEKWCETNMRNVLVLFISHVTRMTVLSSQKIDATNYSSGEKNDDYRIDYARPMCCLVLVTHTYRNA